MKQRNYADGTRTQVDSNGNITAVDNGHGHVMTIQYDQNGQPSAINSLNGSSWVRTGPSTWQSNRGAVWNGTVLGVDQNGNAYYQPTNGNRFQFTRYATVQS